MREMLRAIRRRVVLWGLGLLAVLAASSGSTTFVGYVIGSGDPATPSLTRESAPENALVGGSRLEQLDGFAPATLMAQGEMLPLLNNANRNIEGTLYLTTACGYSRPENFDSRQGIPANWEAESLAGALQAAVSLSYNDPNVLDSSSLTKGTVLHLVIGQTPYNISTRNNTYYLQSGQFNDDAANRGALSLSQADFKSTEADSPSSPRQNDQPPVIPEPGTLLAGALLLLSFVANALRLWPKQQQL